MTYKLIFEDGRQDVIVESNDLPRIGDNYYIKDTKKPYEKFPGFNDQISTDYRVSKVCRYLTVSEGNLTGTGKLEDLVEVYLDSEK